MDFYTDTSRTFENNEGYQAFTRKNETGGTTIALFKFGIRQQIDPTNCKIDTDCGALSAQIAGKSICLREVEPLVGGNILGLAAAAGVFFLYVVYTSYTHNKLIKSQTEEAETSMSSVMQACEEALNTFVELAKSMASELANSENLIDSLHYRLSLINIRYRTASEKIKAIQDSSAYSKLKKDLEKLKKNVDLSQTLLSLSVRSLSVHQAERPQNNSLKLRNTTSSARKQSETLKTILELIQQNPFENPKQYDVIQGQLSNTVSLLKAINEEKTQTIQDLERVVQEITDKLSRESFIRQVQGIITDYNRRYQHLSQDTFLLKKSKFNLIQIQNLIRSLESFLSEIQSATAFDLKSVEEDFNNRVQSIKSVFTILSESTLDKTCIKNLNLTDTHPEWAETILNVLTEFSKKNEIELTTAVDLLPRLLEYNSPCLSAFQTRGKFNSVKENFIHFLEEGIALLLKIAADEKVNLELLASPTLNTDSISKVMHTWATYFYNREREITQKQHLAATDAFKKKRDRIMKDYTIFGNLYDSFKAITNAIRSEYNKNEQDKNSPISKESRGYSVNLDRLLDGPELQDMQQEPLPCLLLAEQHPCVKELMNCRTLPLHIIPICITTFQSLENLSKVLAAMQKTDPDKDFQEHWKNSECPFQALIYHTSNNLPDPQNLGLSTYCNTAQHQAHWRTFLHRIHLVVKENIEISILKANIENWNTDWKNTREKLKTLLESSNEEHLKILQEQLNTSTSIEALETQRRINESTRLISAFNTQISYTEDNQSIPAYSTQQQILRLCNLAKKNTDTQNNPEIGLTNLAYGFADMEGCADGLIQKISALESGFLHKVDETTPLAKRFAYVFSANRLNYLEDQASYTRSNAEKDRYDQIYKRVHLQFPLAVATALPESLHYRSFSTVNTSALENIAKRYFLGGNWQTQFVANEGQSTERVKTITHTIEPFSVTKMILLVREALKEGKILTTNHLIDDMRKDPSVEKLFHEAATGVDNKYFKNQGKEITDEFILDALEREDFIKHPQASIDEDRPLLG